VNRVLKFNPDEDEDVDGFSNFTSRENLLNACINGSLIIEVRMKERTPIAVQPPPEFIHTNPINKNILKLFWG